jgi:hypothetical protein
MDSLAAGPMVVACPDADRTYGMDMLAVGAAVNELPDKMAGVET